MTSNAQQNNNNHIDAISMRSNTSSSTNNAPKKQLTSNMNNFYVPYNLKSNQQRSNEKTINTNYLQDYGGCLNQNPSSSSITPLNEKSSASKIGDILRSKKTTNKSRSELCSTSREYISQYVKQHNGHQQNPQNGLISDTTRNCFKTQQNSYENSTRSILNELTSNNMYINIPKSSKGHTQHQHTQHQQTNKNVIHHSHSNSHQFNPNKYDNNIYQVAQQQNIHASYQLPSTPQNLTPQNPYLQSNTPKPHHQKAVSSFIGGDTTRYQNHNNSSKQHHNTSSCSNNLNVNQYDTSYTSQRNQRRLNNILSNVKGTISSTSMSNLAESNNNINTQNLINNHQKTTNGGGDNRSVSRPKIYERSDSNYTVKHNMYTVVHN